MNSNLDYFINEYSSILNKSAEQFNQLSDEEKELFESKRDFVIPLEKESVSLEKYINDINAENISTIKNLDVFKLMIFDDSETIKKMIVILRKMFNNVNPPEHQFYFIDVIFDSVREFYPDIKGCSSFIDIKNKIKNKDFSNEDFKMTDKDYFIHIVIEDATKKYIYMCEIKKMRTLLFRMIKNYNNN